MPYGILGLILLLIVLTHFKIITSTLAWWLGGIFIGAPLAIVAIIFILAATTSGQ